MFGSLVVVFSVFHEGGALLLRQGVKEWTLDSAKAIDEALPPAIAYVSFYSDTEHEVTKIESCYRVTEEDEPDSSRDAEAITPFNMDSNENGFKYELERLLSVWSFFPSGGYLVWTSPSILCHRSRMGEKLGGNVSHLAKSLKGFDAFTSRLAASYLSRHN